MSWRTQSCYKGLSDADQEWLKGFDRNWDTKSQGRSRQDAFEHIRGKPHPPHAVCPKSYYSVPKIVDIPATEQDEIPFEVKLVDVASQVARYTVPRKTQTGWSIHLILRCGKRVRARFSDKASVLQAYMTLQEFSSMMLTS